MLGSYFKHETGASPGWLLRVKSNRSRTGEAAVKVRGRPALHVHA